jgi:hypothetical protein
MERRKKRKHERRREERKEGRREESKYVKNAGTIKRGKEGTNKRTIEEEGKERRKQANTRSLHKQLYFSVKNAYTLTVPSFSRDVTVSVNVTTSARRLQLCITAQHTVSDLLP